MSSVLNVDTIADKAGTGPVALTKQHAAKAWGHFTMSSTTPRDSFNISSLTDEKTGIFTAAYVSSMSSVNYSPSTGGTHKDAVSENGWVLAVQHAGSGADDMTTGELSLSAHNASSALVDTVQATFQIFGDLA